MIKVHVKNIREIDCPCDVLILTMTEGGRVPYERLGSQVSHLLKRIYGREFKGTLDEVLLVHAPESIKPERLLLVGLGKKKDYSHENLRRAGGRASGFLRDKGLKKIAISTEYISSLKSSPAYFLEGFLLGAYTFKKYRSGRQDGMDSLTVLSQNTRRFKKELDQVKVVASSVWFARDLVNTPANDMTPSNLADAARSLRKNGSLVVKVFDKKDMQKSGMGAYLSVAKGTKEPPKFIIIEYKGAKKSPLVLIGKSVTFDSGGLSLKPAEGMEKMKYDMAGGAAVLGIMKASSELKFPVHLVGLLPATENMPGGSATRPGDIVKASNEKTIEIISTDAEGRMALVDAITYSRRYRPQAIIDIATLTGACSIALGGEAIAMMGNDPKFMDNIRKAAERTGERVWEMPLFKEYGEYLKSDIADIKNYGGKNGALVTSAYFLYDFAGTTPWVHLDIAGTAWLEKEKPYIPKGASGIGVRLVLDLIKNLK
ncbi:MAG: leucyl aminopeptidase [Nitrospirota bacterium]